MSDDSLSSSSSLPASSAYGDSETSTTAASSLSTADSFPSLVLPPESHLAALPPPGYQPATVHNAGSDTSPSFVSGSLATAGSSPSVVSSSVHPGFNGTVFESNAMAATNRGSAVSGFVPAQSTGLIPSHTGVSGGIQPHINSTASSFVPAFLTGIAPLHPGKSGAPALGLGKKPLAVNATRTINGTAYVQSTFNFISPSGCTNFFGGPCFRPPVFVKKPPVFLRPATALLPSTSTPTSPQQTALTDTQPSQSAVAPAPVGTPVSVQSQTAVPPAPVVSLAPVQSQTAVAPSPAQPFVPLQSQTAVDIGVAAMPSSPVIHGKEPAPVAAQPSQPIVSNVATQPQVIQPAAPVISPVPGSLAVVVGGQTLANNGPPAVIGGQTARVSGGSIYVGTSAGPVPQAQLPQNSPGPDLIADSLTFAALPGNPTAKQTPNPVVAGGLTFSAALTNIPGDTSTMPVQPNAAPAQSNAPPVQPIAVPTGSNAAPAQPNSLPVVVGGVTYAPVQLATQVAANNINVPPGGTSSTLEQPKAIPGSQTPPGGTNPGPGSGNTVAGPPGQEGSLPAPPNPILPLGNTIPGQSGQLPGSKPLTQEEGNTPMAQANPTASQENSAPIVLGGITYTPVAAQPSAQAANPAPLDLVNTAGGKTQPAAQPLIENGVTMPVQGVVPAPTPVGIVGGQTIYRQGSTAVVGSQTVAQGSAPVLVDNTPVALGPSAVVVGTNTIALPPANPQVAGPPTLAGVSPTPLGVVGGQTIYRQGSTAVVGSQTITQGAAPISVGNTPVALGPSAIVIGTNTISLARNNPQIDTASTSVGIVGGQTMYRQGSSAVIGSQTVVQGSAPITVDSTPVALGPSAIVIGTKTVPLPSVNAAVTTPAVYSFGGIAVTQGGAPVTISGTAYSPGPSFVVEGTKTIPLSAATASNPVLMIAGQTITAIPTGFSIDGTSVMPNGPAMTMSGTLISLNPSGVVVGSSTLPFPSPAATSSVLIIGSQTFTALPTSSGGGYEIDHSTLLPGSSAVVISGTTYSLNTASSLVIGTSTFPLATAGPSPNAANGALTAGGKAFTPLGSTAVLVNGTTLSLSGPAITDNGTVLSLASGGIVVGSSTYAYAAPASNPAVTTTSNAAIPSVFTADGNTFTAYGKGLAIDGTQVLQGSSAVFVSGTPISLGTTGLVIGTSTVPLASVTGLGPALSGGLGSPTPTASAGSGANGSSGAASVRDEGVMWRKMVLWAAVMGFMTM